MSVPTRNLHIIYYIHITCTYTYVTSNIENRLFQQMPGQCMECPVFFLHCLYNIPMTDSSFYNPCSGRIVGPEMIKARFTTMHNPCELGSTSLADIDPINPIIVLVVCWILLDNLLCAA